MWRHINNTFKSNTRQVIPADLLNPDELNKYFLDSVPRTNSTYSKFVFPCSERNVSGATLDFHEMSDGAIEL